MLSSLEIAQAATLRPIADVAAESGIEPGELEQYGRYKAKVDLSILDRTDYAQTTANLAYSWTTPTKWYRSMFAIAGGIHQRNWDGATTDFQRQAYYQIELPNSADGRRRTGRSRAAFDEQQIDRAQVRVRQGIAYLHGVHMRRANLRHVLRQRPQTADVAVGLRIGHDHPAAIITAHPAQRLFQQGGLSRAGVSAEGDGEDTPAVEDAPAEGGRIGREQDGRSGHRYSSCADCRAVHCGRNAGNAAANRSQLTR